MRPEPATRAALRAGFPVLCLSPRSGGMISPAAQRHEGAAAFAEADCRSVTLANHEPATVAAASGPFCSTRSKRGEAATPGQPDRASVRLRNVPGNYPQESPVAASSAAIIQQVQEHPRVRWRVLSARCSSPATIKVRALVQKLWRMILPCGRPRKTEDIPRTLETKEPSSFEARHVQTGLGKP